MDQKNIIVFVLIFSVVVFRLYQKYGRKDKDKYDKNQERDSSFTSSKDDDYEPYSKK